MATPKFAFDLRRATPLGAAEVAPTTLSSLLVQTLPKRPGANALLLLATGVAVDYEIGVWDETTGTPAWLVVATGSLVAGTPAVVAFPYLGEEMPVYIRRTNITVGAAVILAKQIVSSVAPSAPLPAGAATEATLATRGSEATLAAMSAKLVAPGTWTPATAAAPDDEGIITAAATTLRAFMVANSGANASFIQIFDSATVPVDTTEPRIASVWLAAGQTAVVQLGALALANGLSWASSSTANVKTVTAHNEVQLSAEIG
jgi:hypothetical protein